MDERLGRDTRAIARAGWIMPAALAAWIALAAVAGCGEAEPDGAVAEISSALTSADALGFETVAAWKASSGRAATTATRTQGAAALALTAPVNFTTLVSTPIDSAAAGLVGISNTGSVMAVDVVLPTQQPNPFFFGSLQLLVTVPSRNVFNLFLSQVELTGLPLGTFRTLRFALPDSLRNAMRGATFNDLTFTLALNAPSGATGTYIFDNLRALGATNADFTLTAAPTNVTVVQGGSATSTVTIARVGGFSSAVGFGASGLPAGVTATFAPASTTGTSTVVSFAASAAAAVGSATVSVTGTGGGLARSATINLTVGTAPNFSLTASPAALSIGLGDAAPSTIAVTRTGGFTASVAFGASGLPSGVTATFAPSTTTGPSTTLTLSVSNAAAPGSSTVTITGTGGGLTRSTTLALTVVVPAGDFALTTDPTGASIVQGGSAPVAISVIRLDGFGSSVAFSASGLPAGVSAVFAPSATTGSSTTLTLGVSPSAAVGQAAVTVTGVGGGRTRTASFALFVSPAPVPDFTLTADPSGLSLQQGASASVLIAIVPLGGFTANVALAATGLPSGVTAAFAPVAGGTTLTLTAAPDAVVGSATVTVTGIGGGLTRAVDVALFVAPL